MVDHKDVSLGICLLHLYSKSLIHFRWIFLLSKYIIFQFLNIYTHSLLFLLAILKERELRNTILCLNVIKGEVHCLIQVLSLSEHEETLAENVLLTLNKVTVTDMNLTEITNTTNKHKTNTEWETNVLRNLIKGKTVTDIREQRPEQKWQERC